MLRSTPAILLTVTLAVSSPKAAEAATPDGAAVYHEYCSVCHGDQGNGESRARGSMNPPPRDLTTPTASAELTQEQMLDSVTNGRTGTAMVAWKHQLSSEEIAAVVDYVRDRLMLPATTAHDSPGRMLYADYCSVCHGDQGNGESRASGGMSPPPRSFTSAQAADDLDRERMIFSVKYGRPNTAMAPWGEQLEDTQVAAVVDYIRQTFMSGETLAAHGLPAAKADDAHGAGGHVHSHAMQEMSAGFPDGLVGDVKSGTALYKANCIPCHGEEGDGRGPRAYFINPKPRDFQHPAARASLNRPHLYAAIAEGKLKTEMPAWKFVFGPQEMANVAEYVFQNYILVDAAQTPAARGILEERAHGEPGHAH